MASLKYFHRSNRWLARAFELLTLLFVVITPLLYLSVDHWITNTSIIACLLILMGYFLNKYDAVPWKDRLVIGAIGFSTIYIVAILISQFGRGNFNYKELLDQNRWIVAIPFLIFIYSRKINYVSILDWVLPICVLLSFISSTYFIPSDAWGDRYTISFMDPLAYGFINLALAMYCLASALVDFKWRTFNFNFILKAIGVLVGVYLSIKTGSRSGWFALPFVVVFLIFNLYSEVKSKLLLGLIFASSSLLAIYFLSGSVNARINLLFSEVWEYPWYGGVAPETSIGLRITFYRLGAYYFSQSPVFGWGLRGFESIKDDPHVAMFATPFARDFAMGTLFHSEWTTQAVQFGVLGLLGVFYVFLFPLIVFYKYRNLNYLSRRIYLVGFSYVFVMIVASIGDEVFHSKGMITFYAVIVIGLIATLVVQINAQKVIVKS